MFWILHLLAVLLWLPVLFLTVPLHLFYAIFNSKSGILKQIEFSRPIEVQKGQRNLTWAEGYDELKRFPIFFSAVFIASFLVLFLAFKIIFS